MSYNDKIMEFLYQKLPKDLVYIINDFAKDRSSYDNVMSELQWMTQEVVEEHAMFEDWCLDCGDIGCDFVPMKIMKTRYPQCYDMHMNCVNEIIKYNNFSRFLLSK